MALAKILTPTKMVDRFHQDVVDRHAEMIVIVARANGVSPDWTFVGVELGHLPPWSPGLSANGVQPILATTPTTGLPEPKRALAESR